MRGLPINRLNLGEVSPSITRPWINPRATPTKSAQSGLADFSRLRLNSEDVYVHASIAVATTMICNEIYLNFK